MVPAFGGSVRRVRLRDGVKLAVYERGEGPDLVLIPGLGTDHHAFVWNIEELARDHHCLVLDQRGIGVSDFAPGPYSMALLAADAADVIRELAPGGAHVFGVSMGGMVAQQLAIDFPYLLLSLTLGCTGPGGRSAQRAAPEVTTALLGGAATDPAAAYQIACTVLYEREWSSRHPEVIEDAVSWRSQHPVRPGVFAAQWAAIRHHDTGGSLDRIEAPTLVLHGAADVVMPPGNGEVLRQRIPGARLRLLQGRGHMFFQEDPGLANQLVADHVRQAEDGVVPAPGAGPVYSGYNREAARD